MKFNRINQPHYQTRSIGHILKNKQEKKQTNVFSRDYMINHNEGLIKMKMRMKMKNGPNIYGINKPWSRYGHKYSRYLKCLYYDAYIYYAIRKRHLKLNSWKS